MLYLLSQLTLALVLAGIAGGAFGWLLHRWHAGSETDRFREAVARLQRKLAQAEGDIALLTSDYEELEARSRSERQRLQTENRDIPSLRENLERSQLLVRQMIQQHESRIAELQNEILELRARLQAPSTPDGARMASPVETSDGSRATAQPQVETRDGGSTLAQPPAEEPQPGVQQKPVADTRAAMSAAASRRHSWASMPVPDVPADAEPAVRPPSMAADFTAPLREANSEDRAGNSTPADTDSASIPTSESESESPEQTTLALSDTLFDSVDQVDDLQQIMGIGPVTERALNQLGITSYSQLAELQGHDIERIAKALNIVPARIERDDWVGSARRQLEDVLEEL